MLDFKSLSDEDLIRYINNKILAFALTREKMQESIDYYFYKQEILNKQRLAIGENGKVTKLYNLPNTQNIDNQYAKVLDQKVNYLFSKLPSIKCEDERYQAAVAEIYDKRFLRTLNKIALESYLCGIAWLYIYKDEKGLGYKKMDSKEIIPIWTDTSHESLQALIRTYKVEEFEDGKLKERERVAFYTDEDVTIFDNSTGKLELLKKEYYIKDNVHNKAYSFGKIPFIYFKSNSKEQILLDKCKSIQDGINTILSNFQDNMLEDPRNTILIIKNYDGENLGEFRRNLATYGAVKVRSADGSQGGLDSLEINVNAENYQLILSLLREKLIENLGGIDLKNQKSSQAPNELNIKAMYADIELGANQIELEFTASLEHLEYFFKKIKGIKEDYVSDISFKRNIMVNEESLVGMIANSYGIVSKKTLLNAHPLVSDVNEELEEIKKENEDSLYNPFKVGAEDELLGEEGKLSRKQELPKEQ